MLNNLHIENIAVIEKADIDFSKGLNILTGETGAGKSIVIDSLQAVLGGRVSRELVRTGSEKASVSAVFTVNKETDAFLNENDIDADDELIIQRKITPDGKSSCRINGNPVPVQTLKSLGALLLDIHGQNDGRRLLDESYHLNFLDSFGGFDEIKDEYKEKYSAWLKVKKDLDALKNDNTDKSQLAEILQFKIKELESANLQEGETAELEAKHDLMKNAEKLSEFLTEAYDSLYEKDESAISLADNAYGLVSSASRYAEGFETCVSEIKEAKLLLQDASEIISDFMHNLDFSPEEYDRVESRLSKLERLYKKYMSDEPGLIALLEESKDKLNDIEFSDVKIEKLEKELLEKKKEVLNSGKKLHDARIESAKNLSKRIEAELKDLSMPSVKFEVSIIPKENDNGFDKTGIDEVAFLMSANAGEKPGKISRIASGGEFSRIMLAMKTVFAENDIVESMVFDEIDTGVSGIAAQRVGEKLSKLSNGRQVICITHLPQIAAMADAHYRIEKKEQNGRTFTSVTELDEDGEIAEIARLRDGDAITDVSIKAAKAQKEAANKFKEA